MKAGVLSTVIVISILMMISVLAMLALWDTDFLLFTRAKYIQQQRNNIESALIIYCNAPNIIDRLDPDSTLILFDSIPSSRVKISRRLWGLYEVINLESKDGKVKRSAICGLREISDKECVFWCRNNNNAITLSGRSTVKGNSLLPNNGVIYGQMQSVFFNGEQLNPNSIGKSEKNMPDPSIMIAEYINRLLLTETECELYSDSITAPFKNSNPHVIALTDGNINHCNLNGNIILKGREVIIGQYSTLNDVIIVADKIIVEDGFSGSCQLFAKDSVFIGENVVLKYPSGIYSQRYAEIREGSEVNGYMIVDYPGEVEVMNANCRKSRLSKVRGLFYCRGLAQIQGIVSGATYLDMSIFYSPHGYFQNMVYDATFLPCVETAYPLWFDNKHKRKEVKWLH